jgi:hypothetical protein
MHDSEFYEYVELASALNKGKNPFDTTGKKLTIRPKNG